MKSSMIQKFATVISALTLVTASALADQGAPMSQVHLAQAMSNQIQVASQEIENMKIEQERASALITVNGQLYQQLQLAISNRYYSVSEFERLQNERAMEIGKTESFFKRNGKGLWHSIASTFKSTGKRVSTATKNGNNREQMEAIIRQNQYLQARYQSLEFSINANQSAIQSLTALSGYPEATQVGEILKVLYSYAPSYNQQVLQFHCRQVYQNSEQSFRASPFEAVSAPQDNTFQGDSPTMPVLK